MAGYLSKGAVGGAKEQDINMQEVKRIERVIRDQQSGLEIRK